MQNSTLFLNASRFAADSTAPIESLDAPKNVAFLGASFPTILRYSAILNAYWLFLFMAFACLHTWRVLAAFKRTKYFLVLVFYMQLTYHFAVTSQHGGHSLWSQGAVVPPNFWSVEPNVLLAPPNFWNKHSQDIQLGEKPWKNSPKSNLSTINFQNFLKRRGASPSNHII